MDKFLSCLYDFVCIFLLVFIVYSVFLNKNRKEYKKLKKNDMIRLFIARYNLDMKKTKYELVLRTETIINSFIISFCSVIQVWNSHSSTGMWTRLSTTLVGKLLA